MQSPTTPRPRPVSEAIRSKRHALLGVACAFGLVLVPIAGSAVVVAVTETPRLAVAAAAGPSAPVISTQIPVQLASPVAPSPEPAHDPRRAGSGR